jgi:hypothetical protein
MTDPDRLGKIKERMAERVLHPNERSDVDWLVSENERLRGLLGRLEWAGQPVPEEGMGRWPMCPVCEALNPPYGAVYDMTPHHEPGCWLAAELHP